jgi:hypothetical protein
MNHWSDPRPLADFRTAKKGPGIYMIGLSADGKQPPQASTEYDDYFGQNFPDNFFPLYVGISESTRYGVQSRIYSHGRKTGNKYIKTLLLQKTLLYFTDDYGPIDYARLEVFFMAFQYKGQFAGNVRREMDRYARRIFNREWAKKSLAEQEFVKMRWEDGGDGM